MARRIGRRVFLHSAGGALLGLPFLESLLPREVAAQSAPVAKRLVAIRSCSGQFVTDWFPTATPAGYQLRDAMYGGPRADGTTALNDALPGSTTAKQAKLSDFATTGVSKVVPTDLNPYLDKMLLLRGLDLLQGTSHGNGMLLGNLASSGAKDKFAALGKGFIPTLDQVLAYSPKFYPTTPAKRSLAMSTGSPDSVSHTNYGVPSGKVEIMSSELEPQNIWDELFKGFMTPGMPKDDPNRLLMNAVHADYLRLENHSRLSAADKMLLDRHASFLADIERALAAMPAVACTPPTRPPNLGTGYPWDTVPSIDMFKQAVQLLVDISCAAFRCDLTRIATVMCDMALSSATGMIVNHFHNSADVAGDWHQFAHQAKDNPLNRAHLVSLNKWVVTDVFGRYLQQLDVPEANGKTYLDNSLVLMGGELAMDHYVISQPLLMAGAAGGALKTGLYVDYSQMTNKYANAGLLPWGVLIPGIPYNRLYVTILQAMGLKPSDYETPGQPGYGYADIFDGPYNWPADAYDMTQIGTPLPGIYTG
jgi:hypothetical protein